MFFIRHNKYMYARIIKKWNTIENRGAKKTNKKLS